MFIFAPEIFIPYVYGTKNRRRNRRQKMEAIYGTGFCRVCHGYNSIDYSFVYCLVLPYSVLTEQEAQIADHTAYDALINCHLLVTSMTISPMFTAT